METLPPKNVSNSDYTLLVTRQQNCTRLILVLNSLIDMLNIRMYASLCFKRMHAHVSSLLRTHLSTITPSFHRSTRHQNSFLSQDHAPVILWTSRDPIHADAMFALLALLSDGKVRFRTVVRTGPDRTPNWGLGSGVCQNRTGGSVRGSGISRTQTIDINRLVNRTKNTGTKNL